MRLCAWAEILQHGLRDLLVAHGIGATLDCRLKSVYAVLTDRWASRRLSAKYRKLLGFVGKVGFVGTAGLAGLRLPGVLNYASRACGSCAAGALPALWFQVWIDLHE
jgi:hypothetical protein